MPRIPGHYEFDDPELTPGLSKDGGLHQNLYDSDGNLKTSARFVPKEESDEENDGVFVDSYMPTEERRRTQEEEELFDALSEIISRVFLKLLGVGIEKGIPAVQAWWRHTAKPYMSSTKEEFSERKSKRKIRKRKGSAKSADGVEADQKELIPDESETQPAMSASEAQARLIAAMAAQAYSEEQLNLVAQVRIIDNNGQVERDTLLNGIPMADLVKVVEQMACSPELLEDQNLAGLANNLYLYMNGLSTAMEKKELS